MLELELDLGCDVGWSFSWENGRGRGGRRVKESKEESGLFLVRQALGGSIFVGSGRVDGDTLYIGRVQ